MKTLPEHSPHPTPGATHRPGTIASRARTPLHALGLLLALSAIAPGCGGRGAAATAPTSAAAMPAVFQDGEAPRPSRVDGMHQTRFIEVFLAGRDPQTGNIIAACYNSMFAADGIPPSKDTAPQALVEGLSLQRIQEEHGVLNASLNGPKLWLPDWTEIDVGTQRRFGGIPTAWVAQLDMGDNARGVGETKPYEPQAITRKSSLGWNAGTTVLLIDDAGGNTWIMKGYQLGDAPRLSYDDFLAATPGVYKDLPAGWGNIRVQVLEADLVETPEGGVATIMTDEFFNVWDKTGPGMTNYTP